MGGDKGEGVIIYILKKFLGRIKIRLKIRLKTLTITTINVIVGNMEWLKNTEGGW